MTKSELILQISSKCSNMSRKQVESIVNSVFAAIKQALASDDKVELRGFGSFRIRHKTAKIGRNPKTGEKVNIPDSKVPYFRPGIEIKEQLLKKDLEIVHSGK